MGRFFNMDNKFFTFMSKSGRSVYFEYHLSGLLYSDRYCRSIYYGYVLCDTEDGPE